MFAKPTLLATLFAASCALPVFAADAAKAEAPAAMPMLNKQQNKMAMCNQEAGDKKGAERKAFMSGCLKKKPMMQQEKMKQCNKDAAGKKGDERKAFMSDCLKAG